MTQTTPKPSSPSPAIVASGHRVIARSLLVERAPGYCLKLTRQVIEDALNLGGGGFYRFVRAKVEPRHEGFWARDAQRSMRLLGWAVPLTDLQPGDIVCNSRVSKPYGHIGVYMGDVPVRTTEPGGRSKLVTLSARVLENTDSSRGYRLGGAVALTPVAAFDPDEAFRIPADYRRF